MNYKISSVTFDNDDPIEITEATNDLFSIISSNGYNPNTNINEPAAVKTTLDDNEYYLIFIPSSYKSLIFTGDKVPFDGTYTRTNVFSTELLVFVSSESTSLNIAPSFHNVEDDTPHLSTNQVILTTTNLHKIDENLQLQGTHNNALYLDNAEEYYVRLIPGLENLSSGTLSISGEIISSIEDLEYIVYLENDDANYSEDISAGFTAQLSETTTRKLIFKFSRKSGESINTYDQIRIENLSVILDSTNIAVTNLNPEEVIKRLFL